jgi:hypothetical protein
MVCFIGMASPTLEFYDCGKSAAQKLVVTSIIETESLQTLCSISAALALKSATQNLLFIELIDN